MKLFAVAVLLILVLSIFGCRRGKVEYYPISIGENGLQGFSGTIAPGETKKGGVMIEAANNVARWQLKFISKNPGITGVLATPTLDNPGPCDERNLPECGIARTALIIQVAPDVTPGEYFIGLEITAIDRSGKSILPLPIIGRFGTMLFIRTSKGKK